MAKEKKNSSMRTRRIIADTVTHIALAVLAFIWVIPIVWIILLSFSTQKGSYVTSFFPKGYTLGSEFPTDVQEYIYYCLFCLCNIYIFCTFSCLLLFKIAF